MKDKTPLESKKFIAFIIGSVSIISIFVIGYISVLYPNEYNITSLINLCTTTIVTMGGLTTSYATGQAIIDFKMNANLEKDAVNIGNREK